MRCLSVDMWLTGWLQRRGGAKDDAAPNVLYVHRRNVVARFCARCPIYGIPIFQL